MRTSATKDRRWGVILAGGEGTRLRSLTRLVSGDDRPKQFCRFPAGGSLLSQTRRRIARTIPQDRTVFVLVASHERFYTQDLEGIPPAQVVVQPGNRGTLPAILSCLLEIVRVDERALVAFFPSDHHYSDEGNFIAGVELVGHVRAFLDMIRAGAAEVYRAFEPMRGKRSSKFYADSSKLYVETINRIYENPASTDFSGLILSATPEKQAFGVGRPCMLLRAENSHFECWQGAGQTNDRSQVPG